MNTFVVIISIVVRQGLQHPQFYSRGVSVLLDRTDDLDGTFGPRTLVIGFDHLAKRALT